MIRDHIAQVAPHLLLPAIDGGDPQGGGSPGSWYSPETQQGMTPPDAMYDQQGTPLNYIQSGGQRQYYVPSGVTPTPIRGTLPVQGEDANAPPMPLRGRTDVSQNPESLRGRLPPQGPDANAPTTTPIDIMRRSQAGLATEETLDVPFPGNREVNRTQFRRRMQDARSAERQHPTVRLPPPITSEEITVPFPYDRQTPDTPVRAHPLPPNTTPPVRGTTQRGPMPPIPTHHPDGQPLTIGDLMEQLGYKQVHPKVPGMDNPTTYNTLRGQSLGSVAVDTSAPTSSARPARPR